MTYAESVAYLYRLQKHGIKLGLETMTALMDRMAVPHRRYRTLHVAGTNGKGSTAAMAAAVLQAAGYRVGLYTSPHLVEFRERIRVNGDMIGEVAVARLTEGVRSHCQADLVPTFFEYTTAMALQHFADAAVDVAVLEVGLGGRFDATNVVTPLSCAITTIALDHQEYLGSSLSSIAFEKAGIIKPGVPVVVGRVDEEAWRRIAQVADERRAPLMRLDRDFSAQGAGLDEFFYRGRAAQYNGLTSVLEGRHQMDNAACALALLETAGQHGLQVSEEAVRNGLKAVRWEGRLELVERRPVLVLDGAHNPAAAIVLADYLRDYRRAHPLCRVILVWGMMRDKDHRGFLSPLIDIADEIILTQADLPRSATVGELRQSLEGSLCRPHVCPMLSEAIALARRIATPDDLICVTGSLMLVGEMKALLHGCGLSPIRG